VHKRKFIRSVKGSSKPDKQSSDQESGSPGFTEANGAAPSVRPKTQEAPEGPGLEG
jgi:hypothetical protein